MNSNKRTDYSNFLVRYVKTSNLGRCVGAWVNLEMLDSKPVKLTNSGTLARNLTKRRSIRK